MYWLWPFLVIDSCAQAFLCGQISHSLKKVCIHKTMFILLVLVTSLLTYFLLCFVDPNSHSSVPEQRARVRRHQSDHYWRKPWSRQQR